MQTPNIGPAAFLRGDRVIYRPRPRGVETVEIVEYRGEGWGGWYIRTKRRVGPTETQVRHYDCAQLFDLATAAATVGRERWWRRLLRRWRGGGAVMVVALDVPPAERASSVAGWPPVSRGGLAGLGRAIGDKE